ncbi:Malate synthase [Caldibacillus debilis GB1]|uniref:Malate synthase n=1 Tax=Caldibacillus debilis GB1 TaxID=1339248 RepID=A0A420VG46_9BACI|nr:Malate synthase [Caldibacillus debilis GB1]
MALQKERTEFERSEILTEEAEGFLKKLHRQFEGRRREILKQRQERQRFFDRGMLPDFLKERRRSVPGIGRWLPFRRICRTGGWKSPDRPAIRKWSSTP